MQRSQMSLAIILAAFAHLALAAPPPRIRGTVQAVSGTVLTVATQNGQTETINLKPSTKYAAARKSTLGAITAGSFIGTATKTVGNDQVALEVVIFPPSMRGTGEGHYPWDTIQDTTAGSTPVASSMTNGNVASSMPTAPMATTGSSMTNGNVQASAAAGGDTRLTVTYKGGSQTILVPPTAPVVMLSPADASALSAGDSIFIIAHKEHGQMNAKRVIVGLNGTKLPM